MKKDSKKDLIIAKALDALRKQALNDQEIRKIKGGIEIGTGGHTTGMWSGPD